MCGVIDMHVTAAMVHFMLEQAGYPTLLQGDPGVEVSRLRLQKPGRRQEGTLYVAEASKQTNAPATSKENPVRTSKETRGAKGKQHACIIPAAECALDAVGLLEAASDAVSALQSWDIRLKDALAADIPLSDFVHLGEEVIPYAYGVYDKNLSALGASSNYLELLRGYSGNDSLPDSFSDGSFPSVQLVDLFEDEDYQNAPQHREPFYYASAFPDGATNHSYCLNLFDGDEYIARFVILASPHTDRLPLGAEQLCKHFVSALEIRFLRFTGSGVTFGNQHDAMHELFSAMLFATIIWRRFALY